MNNIRDLKYEILKGSGLRIGLKRTWTSTTVTAYNCYYSAAMTINIIYYWYCPSGEGSEELGISDEIWTTQQLKALVTLYMDIHGITNSVWHAIFIPVCVGGSSIKNTQFEIQFSPPIHSSSGTYVQVRNDKNEYLYVFCGKVNWIYMHVYDHVCQVVKYLNH